MTIELTMKSLYKVAMVAGAACMVVSCSDSADGVWLGECRNDTVGTKSGMQMTIRQDGDKLQGILMLKDELYGSGHLSGLVIGKDVTIRSEGDGQTFVNIIWSGRLKGDVIKGTYRVEPTPSAAMLGRSVQNGTFILNRK